MNNINPFGLIILGLFLAIGLTGGGYFIGQTMYNAKVAVNTAEAKGLAERRVKANHADWTIGYSVKSKDRKDMEGLYKKAEKSQREIVKMLKLAGFNDDEIQLGVIDYRHQEYRDSYQNITDENHILEGAINISTNKVDMISEARAKVSKLIAQGLQIDNRVPAYRFTKLNEIKPDMLKEAAKNARIAASEFAENAGASVGKIQSARQGGFIIRDAGAAYGDTGKIYKDVRVVTTISFYLND